MDASDIIKEIKEQENKGIFKSLRKRKIEKANYCPTLKSLITNLPFHIQNAIKITGEFKVLEKIDRIIISGTGINSSAGHLFKAYLDNSNLNVSVCTDFSLPESVNNKTLIFVCTYSGNEPEAILTYRNALRKGCKVIVLTSGGRMLEILKKGNSEHIMLPSKLIEAATMPYLFFPMLKVLENSRLINDQKKIIDDTIKALKKPAIKEMGVQLSEKIRDKIPIIYTSSSFSPIAKYWKIVFNLTSKVPCFNNELSDSAYYELNSYAKDLWDFYVIFLSDQEDQQEVQKSMEKSKEIIKNKGYSTTEINVKGTNALARYFSAISIADHASTSLSEYYNIDEDMVKSYREQYKPPQ